ncbi:MAG: hypothetical protein Q7V63_01605 [Gammaproteobacteria bacterium]|nr:hypothetical protein [Gammaproteobacteria bacterium]
MTARHSSSKAGYMPNMKKASLEELSWDAIRVEFAQKNATLAKIIDDLSPSKEYTLFKAKYPYGAEIVRGGNANLPNEQGQCIGFHDSNLNAQLREKLLYNKGSTPVSMVLKNSVEIFIEVGNNTIPFYGAIPPGKIFGTWKVLNPHDSHTPAFLWNMTAGARSLFMMPKISEKMKHNRLKRDFGITADTPKTLLDHWEVFSALANSAQFGETWEAEILFFPKKWFEKLDDAKWLPFKCYLLESSWKGSEYLRNLFFWDIAFSLIQQQRGIKPNPYIADTVKHLLGMGIGALPGFAPSIDDTCGPIKRLEEIYSEVYQLDYAPIIMDLHNFSSQCPRPIYYSLAYPTTTEFSPKSRLDTSKISDLYEIKSLLNKYLLGIFEDNLNLQLTPLSQIPKTVQYDFFHTDNQQYQSINSSLLLPKEDFNFQKTPYKSNKGFPENSSFIKGCIRISESSAT